MSVLSRGLTFALPRALFRLCLFPPRLVSVEEESFEWKAPLWAPLQVQCHSCPLVQSQESSDPEHPFCFALLRFAIPVYKNSLLQDAAEKKKQCNFFALQNILFLQCKNCNSSEKCALLLLTCKNYTASFYKSSVKTMNIARFPMKMGTLAAERLQIVWEARKMFSDTGVKSDVL